MSNNEINILLVDDEPLVLNSLSGLLREFGYSVTPCKNGKEALAKPEHFDPAVLNAFIEVLPVFEEIYNEYS